jgi:membrane associated rhomboid family serine protease
MFEDRGDVCRSARSEAQPSVTLLLILVNVAAFVGQNIGDYLRFSPVSQSFALSLAGLRHGYFWQLITFQFLHIPLADGGMFHLLGDVFVIYVFGRILEQAIGKSGFLALYLLGGIVGGLLQMAVVVFFPARFGLAVVGASAGACGLIAAFATLLPRRPLSLFFLPIRFQARTLLWLAVLASLAGLFLPGRGVGVAHAAHLGGLLTGILFARWIARTRPTPAFAANPVGGPSAITRQTE